MRVKIDIPFLMEPSYLQANIIEKDFLHYIRDSVTFMYNNMDIPKWPPLSGTMFWEFETSKLRRLYYMVEAKPLNQGCLIARKNFYNFINEHDKRLGTNFLEIFPEYEKFYNICKNTEV